MNIGFDGGFFATKATIRVRMHVRTFVTNLRNEPSYKTEAYNGHGD